ncbi:uncharacterized protein LOC111024084 [Momordica charantia]|uniref:Uncharacterized protein LOC111024084 n=1 Tax=Momordica charantia TaxID=3673 RepID=A0A6J1DT63_MOMCH|nr:uncharacterized protein LOC111024084 [Momordica charantia]
MSSLEWGKGRKRMIEEQATEELEALQLLHPDRFEYLKLELKSFIQLLQSQSQSDHPNAHEASKPSPTSLAPDSQESSSCRKRRKIIEESGSEKACGNRLHRATAAESETGEMIGRRNRVDVVLERAVVCLRKIRRFKTALFSAA